MTPEYAVQRQGWRMACGDKCVVRHKGKSAECMLIDISVSGVLVGCDNEFAQNLCLGDSCGLYLCGDPQVCQSEIACKVIRRDAGRIGLQFPSEV